MLSLGMANPSKIAEFGVRNRIFTRQNSPKALGGTRGSSVEKAFRDVSEQGEFRDPLSDDKKVCTIKIMCLLSIG
jgi:hypothetical protein